MRDIVPCQEIPMTQRFRIEIPKGPQLTTFLNNQAGDPDIVIISQEDLGDKVAVTFDNTAAPDLPEQQQGGGGGAPAAGGGGGPAAGGGGAVGGGVGGSGASAGLNVPGTVGPFSNDDWNTYCNVLGKRESGNDYSIVNQLGFSGRWQFGCGALIDGGYVKPGTSGGGAPASASAWTGKDGISSRQDWLANKAVQNSAMVVYTQSHYRSLLNQGGLTATSSLPRVAGLLAAAHLMGVGGAMKMVNGTVTSDANGTTTTSYYELLSKAFGGSGQLES
jgi:hypothetical protein